MKTTAIIAAALLSAFIATPSMAGQAPIDEYSAVSVFSAGEAQERVNYVMDSAPISEELDAELFTDNDR
jgi:hypothetical protein